MGVIPQTIEQMRIYIDACEGHLAALGRRHQEIGYAALRGDVAAQAEVEKIDQQRAEVGAEHDELVAAYEEAVIRRRSTQDRANLVARARRAQAQADIVAQDAAAVDIALANVAEVLGRFAASAQALAQHPGIDRDRLATLCTTGLRMAAAKAGLGSFGLFGRDKPVPESLEAQARATARLPGDLHRVLADSDRAEAAAIAVAA